jgi:hypothetical protein
MGIYSTAWAMEIDMTMGATPPSQLGNADLALNCTEATYKGSTGSPFYLASEADRTAAIDTILAAARNLPLSSTYWATLTKVGWGLAAGASRCPWATARKQPTCSTSASSTCSLAAERAPATTGRVRRAHGHDRDQPSRACQQTVHGRPCGASAHCCSWDQGLCHALLRLAPLAWSRRGCSSRLA